MTTVENIIDATTGLKVLWKKPGDSFLYDIECVEKMRTSDTLSSVGTAVVTNMGNVSGSGDPTASGETQNNATIMQLRLAGGDDLEDYKIGLTGTTAGGDSVVAEVLLRVRANPADVE